MISEPDINTCQTTYTCVIIRILECVFSHNWGKMVSPYGHILPSSGAKNQLHPCLLFHRVHMTYTVSVATLAATISWMHKQSPAECWGY